MAWWDEEPMAAPVASERAVAYYRHSAQDRQKNSVEIQSDQVRAWASDHGVTIIKEFADRGKSGLTAEGRPAFIEMMSWVRTRTDFSKILVLDVSRWGRFQDLDLSAQYASECRQFGKEVTYINLGVERDESPIYPLVVTLERYRSAQYSRELSDKVYKGCMKVAQQGFRNGGVAPYATQRAMVDERGEQRQRLAPGEQKSIANWRMKLVPGNPEQVEVVQFIFQQFADGTLNEYQIADHLNDRHCLSPGGVPWTCFIVRRILRNRTYAGAMVYGRSHGKLSSARRRTPRHTWVIHDGAFPAIVSAEVFERARVRLHRRRRMVASSAILKTLRTLHAQYGILSPSLLARQDDLPSVKCLKKRFGSIGEALHQVYAEVRERVCAQVVSTITACHGNIRHHHDVLIINDKIGIYIHPVAPFTDSQSPVWIIHPDPRSSVDVTIGVLLADHVRGDIVGYVDLPRLMMPPGGLYLSSTNFGPLSLYGRTSLNFIKEYVQ